MAALRQTLISSLVGFENDDNYEQLTNDTKPSIFLIRSNSGVRSQDYFRTASAAHLASVAVVVDVAADVAAAIVVAVAVVADVAAAVVAVLGVFAVVGRWNGEVRLGEHQLQVSHPVDSGQAGA